MNNKFYYSNCLFEAIKYKLKHPIKYKIKYIPPKETNCWKPHWMWYDDSFIYDFYTDKYMGSKTILWWKGYIRKQEILKEKGLNKNE